MPKENILILGINGSPNKKGRCAKILKRCLKAAKKNGAMTKTIHLVSLKNDFRSLKKMLLRSDGFILASPVYWMNVSGLMKNFIDNLTILEEKGFLLENKVAGFIVTEREGGGWEVINAMTAPLNHMGVLTPPYSMIFYNFTLRKQKISRWMDKDIELLGKNIVILCEILKKTKPNWDYGKKFNV